MISELRSKREGVAILNDNYIEVYDKDAHFSMYNVTNFEVVVEHKQHVKVGDVLAVLKSKDEKDA